jgi:hypothetical protein
MKEDKEGEDKSRSGNDNTQRYIRVREQASDEDTTAVEAAQDKAAVHYGAKDDREGEASFTPQLHASTIAPIGGASTAATPSPPSWPL